MAVQCFPGVFALRSMYQLDHLAPAFRKHKVPSGPWPGQLAISRVRTRPAPSDTDSFQGESRSQVPVRAPCLQVQLRSPGGPHAPMWHAMHVACLLLDLAYRALMDIRATGRQALSNIIFEATTEAVRASIERARSKTSATRPQRRSKHRSHQPGS